jgi:hypothetical protein
VLDIPQLKELIIVPTLEAMGLCSKAAVNLLVGTAIIESNLTYVKQKGGGPALGIYQMEPATYKDLRIRLMNNYSKLTDRAMALMCMDILPSNPNYLMGNLYAATIFARLKYFFDREALPLESDYEGLARYYKRIYNTPLGATTIEVATKVFRSVVLDYVYHP